MDLLSTAISTAIGMSALIGCIFCTASAFKARNECHETENSLRRSVGRIAALEAETDVLAKQIQKLRGKFYASHAVSETSEIAQVIPTALVCENWQTAQRDGPSSPAAMCECVYCSAKRAERDAFRARVVPKTNSERKDAIEKGRRD